MEYYPNGDLHHYLHNLRSQMPVDEARELTRQILEGLSDMHLNGFAHRDIKPNVSIPAPFPRPIPSDLISNYQNILIRSKPPDEWWINLTDFGISKRAGPEQSSTAIRGTRGFMAPELQGFGEPPASSADLDLKAADMWALGEITFLLLSGEAAFANTGFFAAYCRGDTHCLSTRLPTRAGDNATQLISKLLSVDPRERLTVPEALEYAWISEGDQHPAESSIDLAQNSLGGASNPWGASNRLAGPSNILTQPVGSADNLSTALSSVGSLPAPLSHTGPFNTDFVGLPSRVTEGLTSIRENEEGHSSRTTLAIQNAESRFRVKPQWRLWHVFKGSKNKLSLRRGLSGEVLSVDFSPAGDSVLSAYRDSKIRIWNVPGKSLLHICSANFSGSHCVRYSPDGTQWSAAADKLFAAPTGLFKGVVLRGQSPSHKITSIAYAPDGRRTASARDDNTVTLHDSITGDRFESQSYDSVATSLAFASDNRHLASGLAEGLVKHWDVRTRSDITTYGSLSRRVASVAYSPDGLLLASCGEYKAFNFRDVRNGQSRFVRVEHLSEVNCVSFDPTGALLASASSDGTVKLWDIKGNMDSSEYTLRNPQNSDGYTEISFSPNGKWLAAGHGVDVEIWEKRES